MTDHEPPPNGRQQIRLSASDRFRMDIETIRNELRDLHVLLSQLHAAQLDTLDHLRRLRADVTKTTELASMVHKHEEDLASIHADRTADRQDIGSESHRQRIEVWKQFDLITSRQVTRIVNEELRRIGELRDRRKKAELISQLVRGLFPPGGDQVARLSGVEYDGADEGLAALAGGAAEIRAEAARLGMASCWELHADWFEQWPYSSGDSRPEFIVLPAWVADDQLIGPGKVFVV